MQRRSINTGQRLSPSARKIIKLRQRAFNSGGASLELQIPTNYIRDISRKLNYDITTNYPLINLFQWTEDYTKSYWTKEFVTITPNIIANPINGLITASKIISDTTNNIHRIYTSILDITTGYYTYSVYLKSAGYTTVDLVLNSQGGGIIASVNLTTGGTSFTTNANWSNVSASTVNMGNGWYRCVFTANRVTANTFISPHIDVVSSNPNVGDGVSGVYVWGVQIERSASVSDYEAISDITKTGASLIMVPNTIGEGRLFNVVPNNNTSTGLRNLIQYSEDFTNAVWNKINITISTNANLNPFGINKSYYLLETASSSTHGLVENSTVSAGNIYTSSFYIKKAQDSWVQVFHGGTLFGVNQWVNFNFDTGLFGNSGNGATYTKQSLSNGYWLITITGVAISSGTNFTSTIIGVNNTNSSTVNLSYTGTTSHQIVDIAAIQFEQSSTPTTYQRTTDGIIDFQATRATTANVVRKDGSIGDGNYNLLQFSEDYTNAVWTKRQSVIVPNSVISPIGNTTGSKLKEDNSISQEHSIITTQNLIISANNYYTGSIYVKTAERFNVMLRVSDGSANIMQVQYNLNTNTSIVSTGGGAFNNITVTAKDVANGYKLITITGQAIISTNTGYFYVRLGDNSGNFTYTGDGNSGIYIWGAQLIQGNNPPTKDYLKTTNRLAVPSIDYSLGSNLPALLVEPQNVNLFLQSENLFTSPWNRQNDTINANTNLNPFGVNKSAYITEIATTGVHGGYQLVSATSGTTYTVSWYVKKAQDTWVQLTFDTGGFGANAWVNFNFDTGLFGNSGGSATYTAKSLINGYWLLTLTSTCISTGSRAMGVLIGSNNTNVSSQNPSYLGVAGHNIVDIAAIQCEVGSRATSYIPTTTATATRNAYTSYVDLWNNSLLNKDNFTLYFEGYLYGNSTTNVMVALSDTTGLSTRGNDIGVFDGCKATYAVGSTVTSDTVNLENNNSFKYTIVKNGSSLNFFRNGIPIWSTQTVTAFDYRYLVVNNGGSTYNLKKLALWKHTKNNIDVYKMSDLVAYYKLDNNSNDGLALHNGTDTNISYVTGKLNNAASFNGSSSYITIPQSTDFDFSTATGDVPFSISFWVNFNSLATGYQTLFGKGGEASQPFQWAVRKNNLAGQIALVILKDGSNYLDVIANGFTFTTGSWYHIVITYDGTSLGSGINFYINGSLTSKNVGGTGVYTKMPITTQSFYIGKRGDSVDFFNGKLDELGIWKNRVLTPTEVTQLYNSGNGLTYTF